MKTRTWSMNKAVALLVVVLMSVLMVAGCGKKTEEPVATTEVTETETPVTEEVPVVEEPVTETTTEVAQEANLTTGVFTYTIPHEGTEYVSLIHFYDNGVFYFSKYNNGQYQAGYYTVDATPTEVKSNGPKSGEGEEQMVAVESKITLYDVDATTVVGEAGYTVGGNIIGLSLQDNKDFTMDPATTHTSDDETGVTMAEFFIENDDYSLVSIKHNGTYMDTTGMLISGSWIKEGTTYQLTDEATSVTYTLTDNGDGTAAYLGEDGTTMTLFAKQEAVLQVVFAGSEEKAAYGQMDIMIGLYDDGSAKSTIQYAGTENITDGTWVMAADYSNITITLGETEWVAPMDFNTQTFSLEYTTNDGVNDITILLTQAQAQ